MDALILATVVLLIVAGTIIVWAGEFGKGADAAKSAVLLAALSLISGFVVALASGSM